MSSICRKIVLTAIAVFLSAGFFAGSVVAASITLDAIEDAGLSPGQVAYIKFQPGNISDTPPTRWGSAQDVYDYAADPNNGIGAWNYVESAGNIWYSDLFVGESLTGLHAGTYRIAPVAGAYTYDSFGWSSNSGEWRWEMHIQALDNNGTWIGDYLLGSTSPFVTADDAFNAVSGSYLDIAMLEGGSLHFWIWDTNSIDNDGFLQASIAMVPEPAALLLLGLGLTALSGLRKHRQ